MSHPLAIVIPVYKGIFLAETLQSLSNQTNKNFTVYIGDDCSPDNIKVIISSFLTELDIRYERFSENLGSRELTGHWQRCISMIQDEEWIWLLPDDDTVSPECIESFYKTVKDDKKREKLYRFQVRYVDENNIYIANQITSPRFENNVEFIFKKLLFQRISSIAEYIFSKKQFENSGGFVPLPLAWGSDDLLWISLSQEHDIETMSVGTVFLRQSRYNISNSKNYGRKKLEAKYQFLKKLILNEVFMRKLLQSHSIEEFRKIMTFHIFCEYRSYDVNFWNLNIFKYALLNDEIIGGGLLRNIYRLARYQIRKLKYG